MDPGISFFHLYNIAGLCPCLCTTHRSITYFSIHILLSRVFCTDLLEWLFATANSSTSDPSKLVILVQGLDPKLAQHIDNAALHLHKTACGHDGQKQEASSIKIINAVIDI